jgi:hypothetical protein
MIAPFSIPRMIPPSAYRRTGHDAQVIAEFCHRAGKVIAAGAMHGSATLAAASHVRVLRMSPPQRGASFVGRRQRKLWVKEQSLQMHGESGNARHPHPTRVPLDRFLPNFASARYLLCANSRAQGQLFLTIT